MEELLLLIRAVGGVFAGLELAEGNGNGFFPACLFMVDQDGIIVDTVLLRGIAVAGGVAQHQHLIGIVAELQHGGDAGGLAAHILGQDNGRKQKDLLVVPGDGFGCPGYFRLCYCVSYDMIQRSLKIFEELI